MSKGFIFRHYVIDSWVQAPKWVKISLFPNVCSFLEPSICFLICSSVSGWSLVEIVGESPCRSPQSSCIFYWNVCESEQDYQSLCLVGNPISNSSKLEGHHCPKPPLVSGTSPRTGFCSACTVSISNVSFSILPCMKDFYIKGPYADINSSSSGVEPLFLSSQNIFIC